MEERVDKPLSFEFQITDLFDGRGLFWIGLTDAEEEGTYIWESGRPLSLDVEAHWSSSEPGISESVFQKNLSKGNVPKEILGKHFSCPQK